MRFLLHDRSSHPPPSTESLGLYNSPPAFTLFGVSFDRQVVLYILVAIAVILVGLCLLVRALILRVNRRVPPAGSTTALPASIEGDHIGSSEREPRGLSTQEPEKNRADVKSMVAGQISVDIFGIQCQALVASFPNFVFDRKEAGKGEGEVTCIICLEDYKENERLRRLPFCGHAFHADCLDPWFKQHTTCPICRVSFLPKSTEEDGESPTPTTDAVESGRQGGAPIGSVPNPQVGSRPETLLQSEPGR